MNPHSLLAVVTGEASDRAVLDTALSVAEPEAAEITVLHVKADPQSVIPVLGDGLSGAVAGQMMAAMEEEVEIRAKGARSTFDIWSREAGIPIGGPVFTTSVQGKVSAIWREVMGRANNTAGYLGRNADLAVLARSGDITGSDAIESCLFNSGRPVLLAPSQGVSQLGRHIGIFWNGSSQAARAVAEAIPLLRKAERVTVYTTGAEGRAPTGGDLSRRLSKMGLTVVVDLVRPALERHGETFDLEPDGQALIKAAERDGVDLIVMGGYGQSRFRELILGGVTSLVIERGRIAALLSH